MTENQRRYAIFACGFVVGATFVTMRVGSYIVKTQAQVNFINQHFEAACEYIQGMHDEASDPVEVREKYETAIRFLDQVYE